MKNRSAIDKRIRPTLVRRFAVAAAIITVGSTAFARTDQWKLLNGYTPPSIRTGASAAFDLQRNETVLFGGVTPGSSAGNFSGMNDDTWTFDGARWTKKNPGHKPPARSYANAVYHAAAGYVILFGGLSETLTPLSDTWKWDGHDWTQLLPLHPPPPRSSGSMAYDPASGTVVLFGGTNTDLLPLNDTWTWNGSDWIQQSPLLSPPGRWDAAFASGGGTLPPILFGGQWITNTNVYFGDTWEWNSTIGTWVPVPGAGPAPRFGSALAYDPALGGDVLFGGSNGNIESACGTPLNGFSTGYKVFNDTWLWNGTVWTQLSPTISPNGHERTAMVYDSAHSRMQIFGGFFWGCAGSAYAGDSNDTWSFDGTTWTELDVSVPDERQDAMFAREAQPGSAILFSGQSEYYYMFPETWRWDGSTWHLLNPAHSPLPRTASVFVFDAARQKTLLFGGDVDTYFLSGSRQVFVANDTWTWDGNDWTQEAPANSPPLREFASAAYDAAHQKVVIFGGTPSDGSAMGDTWTWDGTNWTEEHPVNSPPARFAAAMGYDPVAQQVVLFGGSEAHSAGWFDDTWTWDGTNWTQQFPAQSPNPRAYLSMAYDPRSRGLILFGGCINCYGKDTYADPWRWDGSNWTEVPTAGGPSARTDLTMVDGTSTSPLLVFSGRIAPATPDGHLTPTDSGTTFTCDLWGFNLPPPQINSLGRDRNGVITLNGSAAPNMSILVEATDDLANAFAPLTTLNANATGVFTLTDNDAATKSKRFYRASYP